MYPWNEAKARHKSGQLRKLSLVFWLFFLKTLKKIKTQPRIDAWPNQTFCPTEFIKITEELGNWKFVVYMKVDQNKPIGFQ